MSQNTHTSAYSAAQQAVQLNVIDYYRNYEDYEPNLAQMIWDVRTDEEVKRDSSCGVNILKYELWVRQFTPAHVTTNKAKKIRIK